MEIYWRDNFTCPTESEYKLMTIRKTGGLFMLAIRLMQLFSDSDKDFSKLTAILGLYFQIRDDYCNLTSKEVRVLNWCPSQFSFLMLNVLLGIPASIRIAKASAKTSLRVSSVFPSFTRWTIKNRIARFYVSPKHIRSTRSKIDTAVSLQFSFIR